MASARTAALAGCCAALAAACAHAQAPVPVASQPAPAPQSAPPPQPTHATQPAPAPPARPTCAPYPAQPGERTLSSGGELDLGCVPQASVTSQGDAVVVWGLSEVPGASRLQAALALADAAARAELLASVRVGVTAVLRSGGTTEVDGAAVLESVTSQVSSGLLPSLPPAVHGWRKVQRGQAEVLIVAARITADKRAVRESVEASIWAAQRQQGGTRDAAADGASKVIEALGPGRPIGGSGR